MVSELITALMMKLASWSGRLVQLALHGNDTTENLVNDLSNAVTFMVAAVIRFAPIGIFGLVSSTLATNGFDALGLFPAAGCTGRWRAGGAGDQPAAGVLADPPQPVSAGADLPVKGKGVYVFFTRSLRRRFRLTWRWRRS